MTQPEQEQQLVFEDWLHERVASELGSPEFRDVEQALSQLDPAALPHRRIEEIVASARTRRGTTSRRAPWLAKTAAALIGVCVLVGLGAGHFAWGGERSRDTLGFEEAIATVLDDSYAMVSRHAAQGTIYTRTSQALDKAKALGEGRLRDDITAMLERLANRIESRDGSSSRRPPHRLSTCLARLESSPDQPTSRDCLQHIEASLSNGLSTLIRAKHIDAPPDLPDYQAAEHRLMRGDADIQLLRLGNQIRGRPVNEGLRELLDSRQQ